MTPEIHFSKPKNHWLQYIKYTVSWLLGQFLLKKRAGNTHFDFFGVKTVTKRFIETIKLECLNKFIIFGKRHLDLMLAQFTEYYNHQRSHMSRDHLPPVR